MHDDVPLVVAEVNPDALDGSQRDRRQPQLLDDADGRRAEAALRRGRASSGWSSPPTRRSPAPARRRSTSCSRSRGRCSTASERRSPRVYPHQIAFNVLPQAGSFADGDDHTDEERKLINETRKILGDAEIRVSATCVRVPVVTGHSEAVNVETREPLSPERAPRAARRGARA